MIGQQVSLNSHTAKFHTKPVNISHILMNACNETNLMHYLSSVNSVTTHLHVPGLLVAHNQQVTMYICNSCYVLYVLVDCQLAGLEYSTSKPKTCGGMVT
jgi:hypothetical protein